MSAENSQHSEGNIIRLCVDTHEKRYAKAISNNIDEYKTKIDFLKIPVELLYTILENSKRFTADEAISIISDISNHQKVPIEIISHFNLSDKDRDKVITLFHTLSITETVDLSVNDLQSKVLELESKLGVYENSFKEHINDNKKHFMFIRDGKTDEINVMELFTDFQTKIDMQMAYIQALADYLNIELTLECAVARSHSATKVERDGKLETFDRPIARPKSQISPTRPVNTINDIYECCEKGILTNIKWLIFEDPTLVNKKDSSGKLPIHYAAKKGYTDVLEILAIKGSLIDDKDNNGNTPLHLCAQNGHREACDFLIKKGADVKAVNKMGWSPLRHSVHGGHESVCELLVSHGSDVNEKNRRGITHLYSAAQNGHDNVCKFLIEKDCNLNDKNVNGFTALHVAAQEGHFDVCKVLVESGASIDEKSLSLLTPLHLASMNNHLDIVGLLIDRGANVNAQIGKLSTALHLASKSGFTEVCKLLLSKGANPNIKDINQHTVLYVASNRGRDDICRLLIENGANLN